jgi:hypothetical protein
MWMALLGAYKIHGDMQIGKKCTLENEPIIGYVLLSNIYALTFLFELRYDLVNSQHTFFFLVFNILHSYPI